MFLVFRKCFERFFSQQHEKKTGLNGCVYDFSVDYKASESSEITNINKYLMKKHDIRWWLKSLKNVFSDY